MRRGSRRPERPGAPAAARRCTLRPAGRSPRARHSVPSRTQPQRRRPPLRSSDPALTLNVERAGPLRQPGALRVGSVSAETPIQFRLIENQVVVEILLGGRGPFTSLLDVAVEPSVVDLTLARELGLPIDETAPGEAAGVGAGSATFYPSELPDLQIGEHRVGSIEAVALDLSSLGAKLGRPLHAILGQSFFDGRVVQFDYGQQLFTLDPTVVEEGLSVPIEGAADLTPVVTVIVNGREVPVVLDTGSSLTLGIYLDAVDDLGPHRAGKRARSLDREDARSRAAAGSRRGRRPRRPPAGHAARSPARDRGRRGVLPGHGAEHHRALRAAHFRRGCRHHGLADCAP